MICCQLALNKHIADPSSLGTHMTSKRGDGFCKDTVFINRQSRTSAEEESLGKTSRVFRVRSLVPFSMDRSRCLHVRMS